MAGTATLQFISPTEAVGTISGDLEGDIGVQVQGVDATVDFATGVVDLRYHGRLCAD